MKIELHMFTNCCGSAPSTLTLRRTHESFCRTFGHIKPTIWCDPKPNVRRYPEYKKNLLKLYPVVNETISLSDGYIKSIKSSTADFSFMLEHDWQFVPGNITDSLSSIIHAMKTLGIYHLRFNKRQNKIKGWDKILEPIFFCDMKFCRTNILSNNPHIINRKKYIEFVEAGLIRVKPGSKGVEEIISTHKNTWGAIYGPLDHPATVRHSDGRRTRRK